MPTITINQMLVSALTLTLMACSQNDASKATPAGKNTVAATVNGTAIGESRVEFFAKQRAAHGQPISAETRKEIIEHLSMQLLLAQEAGKKGIEKKQEVADQIDLARQSILANAFVEDYFKTNPVTDEMLKAEYETIKGKMAGSEYKARHILVSSESQAKEIIARLKKKPADFVSLAKEKTKDQGSKATGGDLGWFDPRSMVPEFGAAVAKLTKGNFTEEPVKSQFGYHVILLEDSRPISVPPMEQVKQALQQQVQKQNIQKMLEDLKAKAKIEVTKAAEPAAPAPADSKTVVPAK